MTTVKTQEDPSKKSENLLWQNWIQLTSKCYITVIIDFPNCVPGIVTIQGTSLRMTIYSASDPNRIFACLI